MSALGKFLDGFRAEQIMEVSDPKPERVSQQGPQPDPTLTDDKSNFCIATVELS